MISFIKSNSNIFIFIFLLLLTIDGFLLLIKYRNYLESRPNLKISYDKFRSYLFNFDSDDKNKLAVVRLTIQNISTRPIDITNIKLVYGSKPYLAAPIEITNDYKQNRTSFEAIDETSFFDIDILSDNIRKNTNIPSSGISDGYAFFENIESFIDIESCKIIIETPGKIFEKEITINSINY